MTRCFLQVGFMALLFGAAAEAKPRYGMAGCGLGSAVFDANSGQISAATTNGSFRARDLELLPVLRTAFPVMPWKLSQHRSVS